jgi:ABC-2 type transport system permease protein
MKNFVLEFYRYRSLFVELVRKGIKLKYRRSYLGILWSLIEPLLTMIVLTLVFGTLLGYKTREFPVYILAGRLVYSMFSQGTTAALKSIRQNQAMIKKVFVPKYMYPLSSIVFNYILFLISLIVLCGVAIVLGVAPTWKTFLAVVPLLVLLLLVIGVGLILSCFGTMFRDLEYLWNVGLMLIMYTCAIFYYPEKILGSKYYWLLKYNPLFCVIDNFRACIFGNPMNLHELLYAIVFSLGCIFIGSLIFKKTQDKFILYV